MKRIGKIFITVLLLAVLGSVFVGCVSTGGSYVTRNSVSRTTGSEISMRYEYFNGYKFFKKNFDANAVINFTVESESGELSVVIADEEGNTVFTQEKIEAGSYSVTVPAASKYKITMTAKEHKGSFKFTF